MKSVAKFDVPRSPVPLGTGSSPVTCLIADEESETGTVPEKVRIDSSRIADFYGIGVLAGMFRKFGLRKWLVKGKYQNAALEVFGRADSTIVSVSCQSDARFDLFWLMSSLEAGTYDYTDCDEALLGWVETKYWMPRKRAILAIQKLQGHEDIYSEFRAGISDQGFAFPAADPVCIAGYTAVKLFRNYPLSEIGAYNYLVYLRERPEEALDDLKNGLPRKDLV